MMLLGAFRLYSVTFTTTDQIVYTLGILNNNIIFYIIICVILWKMKCRMQWNKQHRNFSIKHCSKKTSRGRAMVHHHAHRSKHCLVYCLGGGFPHALCTSSGDATGWTSLQIVSEVFFFEMFYCICPCSLSSKLGGGNKKKKDFFCYTIVLNLKA